MIIIQDTREKKGKKDHILDYFKLNNIEIKRIKLNVGDYCIENKNYIVIDLKQNLYELASDFYSKQEKARFQRECKRAKRLGITLYILTEQNFNKEKLLKWKSKRKNDGTLITKATGKSIYGKMQIYSLMFGVKWRFCNKKDTGETILKLLGAGKND